MGEGAALAGGPTEGRLLLSSGTDDSGVLAPESVGSAGEQAADKLTRAATARARMTWERTSES
jgi:hypothetical protein